MEGPQFSGLQREPLAGRSKLGELCKRGVLLGAAGMKVVGLGVGEDGAAGDGVGHGRLPGLR